MRHGGPPLPCLGTPRMIVSVFFYSRSPEGPQSPDPELHKNVSCRKPELCGLWAAHVVSVPPCSVCVQFGFVISIWQVEEAPV